MDSPQTLYSKHVDTFDRQHARYGFSIRAPSAVKTVGDAHVFKTNFTHQRRQLCLRQRAAYSGRPQVDVAREDRRQFESDDDVAEEEPPTWAKDAKDFAERSLFIRDEIQYPI